jgi:hypothetical protein
VRRFLAFFALSVLLLALSATPSSATIHPIVCSENSNAPAGSPAQTQNPPGITNPPEFTGEAAGPDQSRAPTARPIVAMFSNPTPNDTANSFKPQGC